MQIEAYSYYCPNCGHSEIVPGDEQPKKCYPSCSLGLKKKPICPEPDGQRESPVGVNGKIVTQHEAMLHLERYCPWCGEDWE